MPEISEGRKGSLQHWHSSIGSLESAIFLHDFVPVFQLACFPGFVEIELAEPWDILRTN
jgi:hypothetical protein